MSDDFARHLHVLLKTDLLIGRIWLNVLARRFGLFVFAGLIAAFGLGMTNVAEFYALQPSAGPVWAAAIIAIVDFVLAVIVILVSKLSEPGPELEQAFETRKLAIEAVQADTRDLKATINSLGRQIRDTKNSIAGFVNNPLDTALQKLLIPAATSIITKLTSKK